MDNQPTLPTPATQVPHRFVNAGLPTPIPLRSPRISFMTTDQCIVCLPPRAASAPLRDLPFGAESGPRLHPLQAPPFSAESGPHPSLHTPLRTYAPNALNTRMRHPTEKRARSHDLFKTRHEAHHSTSTETEKTSTEDPHIDRCHRSLPTTMPTRKPTDAAQAITTCIVLTAASRSCVSMSNCICAHVVAGSHCAGSASARHGTSAANKRSPLTTRRAFIRHAPRRPQEQHEATRCHPRRKIPRHALNECTRWHAHTQHQQGNPHAQRQEIDHHVRHALSPTSSEPASREQTCQPSTRT